MIIKGWSIKPCHEHNIKVRMGNRQRGFLAHHIEYAPTRREAIKQALEWIGQRAHVWIWDG